MAQELLDRHVVVTGGLGALGRVVVARLVEAGAICRVPSLGAVDETTSGDGRVKIVAGIDLTNEASVGRFYETPPGLWASVHLAGGFAMDSVAATTAASFRAMVEMNTVTAFLCCRAAVGVMRKAGQGGRIVNVAARPGLEPRQGAGMAAYATSKAGVAALTVALAEELKGERILVNAIAPSTLDTPANRAAMPKADPTRWLAPAAAAEAILQLVSPENTEISGAVLPLYARA